MLGVNGGLGGHPHRSPWALWNKRSPGLLGEMALGNVASPSHCQILSPISHTYIIVTSISFFISAHDINDRSSLALPILVNPVYPGFPGTFFFLAKERISGRRSDLLALHRRCKGTGLTFVIRMGLYFGVLPFRRFAWPVLDLREGCSQTAHLNGRNLSYEWRSSLARIGKLGVTDRGQDSKGHRFFRVAGACRCVQRYVDVYMHAILTCQCCAG